MVTKPKVLEFMAKETRQRCAVSFQDLMMEFGLSQGAACDHLRRLWQDRLIRPGQYRPKGLEFRLMEGESVMHYTFYLTPRGAKRLQWYRAHGWTRKIRGYW